MLLRTALLGLTLLPFTPAYFRRVHGKQVKVLAIDPSIAFSDSWYEPQQFVRVPAIDGFEAGGPNSSVCAFGDISRFTKYEGDYFTFTFHGVSVQLVMGSRADHSPFSIEYDGRTYRGDTYSRDIACGPAWNSPRAEVATQHSVRCTNHLEGGRIFLQLLSIVYDDGSDLGPPKVKSGSQSHALPPSSKATGTTRGSAPSTKTETLSSGLTNTSTSSTGGATPTRTPRVYHTNASPNGPDGGNKGGLGGGDGRMGRSGGPTSTPGDPKPKSGDGSGSSQPRQQKDDAPPAQFNTTAVAFAVITGVLSCVLIVWAVFAWRKRRLTRPTKAQAALRGGGRLVEFGASARFDPGFQSSGNNDGSDWDLLGGEEVKSQRLL
ncbi:hypothetical protein AURDEDRAFT_126985 [Auricularia subglabra TFB-10046 SS5]|nr:hypothetical protein AURDEDRAFT_126985 [Auricularia subglabra TFB-10046 SS5]